MEKDKICPACVRFAGREICDWTEKRTNCAGIAGNCTTGKHPDIKKMEA